MWPYLQVWGLCGRFFASMAAKMAQTCVFAAVLAGNVVYRATVCKYGQKCALRWGDGLCGDEDCSGKNRFARAYVMQGYFVGLKCVNHVAHKKRHHIFAVS